MQLAKISLALNALLALGLIFLFVKVYTPSAAPGVGRPTTAKADTGATVSHPDIASDTNTAPILAAGQGQGIYFVNTDTLLARYGSFKKQKASLEAQSRRFEADLQARAQRLQAELAEAQQKMQAGQLTQAQAQEMEQAFQQKQATLQEFREREAGKLVEQEKKLSEKLNQDIQRFLKGFASRRGYRYVLGYTSGGGILYAADSLDITGQVVAGLNKQKE